MQRGLAMMTPVSIIFVILFGIFTTVGGIKCSRGMKQVTKGEADLDRQLFVGKRPACEILQSASSAEIELHSAVCDKGCVKVNGSLIVKTLEWNYEFRGCYDPDKYALQRPAAFPPPPVPIGQEAPDPPPPEVFPTEEEYRCPNYSRVLAEENSKSGVENLTLSFCYCDDEDYCNSETLEFPVFNVTDDDSDLPLEDIKLRGPRSAELSAICASLVTILILACFHNNLFN